MPNGLFQPDSSGFRRHSRAVRTSAGLILLASIGLAGYVTFRAGRKAYRYLAPPPPDPAQQDSEDK
ncbi:hypothetical protein TSOC_008001 [Tetrabaena socialis]|uniref:Uncharacterized protein n=1 Tax=Tetrabaena socialis TaxID=47790 RepID=A0A2J7ZZK2_9CHLO|nr:hypothetical protein TSOC_008001 [Tetrabaena socialis]|eukprot:PNH05700.1 hypothetical protein TSOC_008001 [Tetrabaena socialis]